MYGTIFFAPLMIRSIFYGDRDDDFDSSRALIKEGSSEDDADEPQSDHSSSSAGCGGAHDVTQQDTGAGVAFLSMAPFAAAAAAMVINARLAEAAKERRRHAGVPIGLAAVTMALTPLMLYVHVPVAAFVSLILTAAFIWAFHGPFMSWPATFLKGEEASLGFSLINSFGSLGGFVGPLLLGILADKEGDYGLAMFVLAILLAAGSTGILMFKVPKVEVAHDSIPMEVDFENAEGSSASTKSLESLPILPHHRNSSSFS